MVIHIDEAHALDDDSRKLLESLLRRPGETPFAILLSGRACDELDAGCTPLVDEALPHQQFIQLKELPFDQVQALVTQVLPGLPPSAGLVEFLARKTNGSPLFLEQLALELSERQLLRSEHGELHLQPEGESELPTSITAAMIARLDRQPARVRAAIQTAAVLGLEFEAALLAAMLPEEPDLPAQLRAAVSSAILLPGIEAYQFRQSLLRDAAYDMQPQSSLRTLHARAAAAFQSIHAADLEPVYADLAYHTGLAEDYPAAFAFGRLAGEQAAVQYANRQAVENFQRALHAASRLPPAETASGRCSILLSLGELLVNTGQYQPGDPALEQALALAGELGDTVSQGRACYLLALFNEKRSEYAEALAWIERGLGLLGQQETVETCNLLSQAGLISSRQGNPAQAQEYAGRSQTIAQRLADPKTLARAYNLLGHIARLGGDNQAAIQRLLNSVECHQQSGDMLNEAIAHNQLAIVLWNLGRWQEAAAQFLDARQAFEQVGDLYHRAFVDNNLGDFALNQGRLDEALAYFDQGLAAAEQSGGSPWVLGGFHSNLGAAYVRRGEILPALAHLHTSQAYFALAGARDWLPELNRHQSAAHLLRGDLEQAETHAAQSLALARELNQPREQGCALRLLGEIALRRDQPAAALDRLLESQTVLVNDELELARTRLALAKLHAAQGDGLAIRKMLRECLPVFERLGAKLDEDEARKLP